MNRDIYREKSMKKVSSPEKLNDYIHVLDKGVLFVFLAIFLLLIGFLIWSFCGTLESSADVLVQVEDSEASIFVDDKIFPYMGDGMILKLNGKEYPVISYQTNRAYRNQVDAVALVEEDDGLYNGILTVEVIQPAKLFFN